MIDGNSGATSAWPASYEQQVLSFLTFTLKPYLEEWEDKIPASLLSGKERQTVFVEHKVEGLLRTDSAGRAAFLSQMVQNGLMTRNEGRMKENLAPMEGADELTVQVNLTNLEDLPKVNQAKEPVDPVQKGDINITFPDQRFDFTPRIDVQPQSVVVKNEPPRVNVKVDRRGNVEKTITEYDGKGFPKTVIERNID